jgi:hypothetical protein
VGSVGGKVGVWAHYSRSDEYKSLRCTVFETNAFETQAIICSFLIYDVCLHQPCLAFLVLLCLLDVLLKMTKSHTWPPFIIRLARTEYLENNTPIPGSTAGYMYSPASPEKLCVCLAFG